MCSSRGGVWYTAKVLLCIRGCEWSDRDRLLRTEASNVVVHLKCGLLPWVKVTVHVAQWYSGLPPLVLGLLGILAMKFAFI